MREAIQVGLVPSRINLLMENIRRKVELATNCLACIYTVAIMSCHILCNIENAVIEKFSVANLTSQRSVANLQL